MCYNIAFLEKKMAKYTDRYKNVLPADWNIRLSNRDLPIYYFVSGFVHPILPIVKNSGIEFSTWGLIPFWVKNTEQANSIQSKTLNAVSATAFEKPSFRRAIRSQRCLLGINGFFEWQQINKEKHPYYIFPKNDSYFSLGCIYDTWEEIETGNISSTFSILTTQANTMMEKIHNVKKRMPLIINPEDEADWINPDLDHKQIISLMAPFDQELMDAHPVSNKINNPRNNSNRPEAIEPIAPPSLF